MDFKQIETFLTIAKYKSFIKSSEVLYVSQSTVSNRLRSLEEELDLVLVIRKKGMSTVTLTEKGEEFIDIAKQWVEVYERTRRLSQEQKFQSVSFAGPESINRLLGKLYKEIVENEPAISLYVRTCHSNEVVPMLLDKNIEVGFTYLSFESKEIHMLKIGEQGMNVAMKTSDSDRGGSISVKELDPEKEIQVRGVVNNVPEMAKWHDLNFPRANSADINVDSPVMIVNSMKEGSWCVLPESLANEIRRDGQVKVYQIQEKVPVLPYYIAVRRKSMEYNYALKLFEKYSGFSV